METRTRAFPGGGSDGKCQVSRKRGWEWAWQEDDGSKLQSSSPVSDMAWEAPNLDSNLTSEAVVTAV